MGRPRDQLIWHAPAKQTCWKIRSKIKTKYTVTWSVATIRDLLSKSLFVSRFYILVACCQDIILSSKYKNYLSRFLTWLKRNHLFQYLLGRLWPQYFYRSSKFTVGVCWVSCAKYPERCSDKRKQCGGEQDRVVTHDWHVHLYQTLPTKHWRKIVTWQSDANVLHAFGRILWGEPRKENNENNKNRKKTSKEKLSSSCTSSLTDELV